MSAGTQVGGATFSGLEAGPATVSDAEDLAGTHGFNSAVAQSEYRLAEYVGNDALARHAKIAAAQYKHGDKEYIGNSKKFTGNSQLRHDEWKFIEDALKAVHRDTLVGIRHLVDRGLQVPLDLGDMNFTYEKISDMSGADVDMAGETGSEEDIPVYNVSSIPLPIVHKGFSINLRKLRASRRRGEPIDVSAARTATRKVDEKLEDLLFNGGGPNVGGNSISGYTDHSSRATVTGNATWDGATVDNVIDDVMSTVDALENQKVQPGNTGFDFYIEKTNYQEARAKDSGSGSDREGLLRTLRERFEEDDGFSVRFHRADQLTHGNAVMVKLTPEHVQLASPLDVDAFEWESKGSWRLHTKIAGSLIPVLKDDNGSNLAVAHLSGI